jgi:hypothetical protein
MILRYCIRTCKQRESISKQLLTNLKKYIPSNASIDVINDENGKLSASGLIKYFDVLMTKNIEFDAIVLLDDTTEVNQNIHSNILNSPDLKVSRIGMIHLGMPSSATIFSDNTRYDLDERVFFRIEEVYDTRGVLFTREFIKQFDLKSLKDKHIYSVIYFFSKNCQQMGFVHTIHYPSLVGSIKEDEYTKEYDYEIIDDLFSKTWDRKDKNDVYSRFEFLKKHYKLYEKIGCIDDYSKKEQVPIDQIDQSFDVLNVREDILLMKKNKDLKIYFLDLGSMFTWNVFINQLLDLLNVEVIRSIELAEKILKDDNNIFTNGYSARVEELALQYPNRIGCFWHSSYAGVDLMQENQFFFRFLDAIKNKRVMGFFLNGHEPLIPNAKKFWLPFTISSQVVYQPSHNNLDEVFDFAIVASSPYSIVCKNVLETLILLLSNDLSFVIPKWMGDKYEIDNLKASFNSRSKVLKFETESIPIETEYFKLAKYYLMTSHSDTMPYSCVETINAGVPFVITKKVGWSSFFDKSDCFILDSTNDILDFYKKSQEDQNLRKNMFRKQHDILSDIEKINKTMLLKMFSLYG